MKFYVTASLTSGKSADLSYGSSYATAREFTAVSNCVSWIKRYSVSHPTAIILLPLSTEERPSRFTSAHIIIILTVVLDRYVSRSCQGAFGKHLPCAGSSTSLFGSCIPEHSYSRHNIVALASLEILDTPLTIP